MSIAGLPETLAHLTRIERGLNDLSTVTRLAAGQVHRYLINIVPVDSGRLKNSFMFDTQGSGNSLVGIVYTNVEYAARVNYGFKGSDSLGRKYNQKGSHFIERTMRAQRKPLNDLFSSYVGKLVLSGGVVKE